MTTNYAQDPSKRDFEAQGEGADRARFRDASSAAGEIEARIPRVARQVLEQARKLPSILDDELRENPYRLLGIVGGIGLGVGMLIGSRVMRTILLSVGGYAVTETLRAYVNETLQKHGPDQGTPPPH